MLDRRILGAALALAAVGGCRTAPQQPPTGAVQQQSAQMREAWRSVLMENDRVSVVETAYPRGGSIAMHTHRYPYVVYVIEGTALELTDANGTVSRLELRPGQTLWREAQSHSGRNVGRGEIRLVEVEVKP